MNGFTIKIMLLLFCFASVQPASSQDTVFKAKHAAIYYPYPMYKENWRTSIGLTLLTTPEDVTEEVRRRIPCGDFRVLKRINNHFRLDGRVMFQFLQNHLSAGIQYTAPIKGKLYYSVGNDIGFWFGFLKLEGFNSKALGWMNYTKMSVGYRTRKDLLITLQAQVSFNLYYQAKTGENKFSFSNNYYNGETFTLALEQPFFNKKHLTLAISTINNYFYWQTWSLFYKTNRKVFYPQVTVGLIL